MSASTCLGRACLLFAVIALIGSAIARLWDPQFERQSLALSVNVNGQDQRLAVGGPTTGLPLQRDLAVLLRMPFGDAFRAAWHGVFYAYHTGLHQFSTASDDGSVVWVNDTPVLDNSGRHSRVWRSGVVHLPAGPHRIRIEYEQAGGEAHLETWLRQPGGLSRRLDTLRRQFSPEPLSLDERVARRTRSVLPYVAVLSGCLSYGSALLWFGVRLFRRVETLSSASPADWRLGLTLAVLALPVTVGMLWGLPTDADGWAPDEVSPTRLVRALDLRFMPPWGDVYPPLHFYLLTPLVLLVNTLATADGWSASTGPGTFVLHAGMRAVSVLMTLGTLAWMYLLVRMHGSRADAFAAVAIGGTCSTLLYYGKMANVDVPYLYWVLCAVTCGAGMARTGASSLALLSAAAGAAAVGTKDQAAGFLVFAPVWFVAIRARAYAAAGSAAPWRTALLDPLWLRTGGVALFVLCAIYLWPIAWTAPGRHLAIAKAARYAPMVEASLAGHLRLLGLHGELLLFMLGPPVALLALCGLVWTGRHRRDLLVAIAVPVVSYVGVFLPAIRYTYDRFLLGVALLLVCAAGPFCVWLWQQQRRRILWRPALVAGAIYTLGHGLTVNALLLRDSRYEVERALQHRAATRRELLGLVTPRMYLPRADLAGVVDLPPEISTVQKWSPDVLVVSPAYLDRFRPDQPGYAFARQLTGGTLGYTRWLSHQDALPWWAFAARWPYLTSRAREGLTNLDKINPRIDVWERQP